MELGDLRELLKDLSLDEIDELISDLPDALAEALASDLSTLIGVEASTESLLLQAGVLLEDFKAKPHLIYLSEVITQAVKDVEAGQSRRIIVEMPPRTGKTTLATMATASWALSRNPKWPIALTSHDGGLATSWGRQIRRWVEDGRLGEHIKVAPDAGAAGSWETREGGKLLSLSIRESFTGRGAKVLLIDDPHKDFVDAHSKTMRDNVWDWWLSVAQTRLEPPSLVVVTQTRWHEDDFIGRLLSKDYPGDPQEWEVIRFPAIAEDNDVLGREPGQPLFSPLLEETEQDALARWAAVKESVGSYVWSAMYQQRPAPSKGAIFDTSWWKFWTLDPAKATEDGRVEYVDPSTMSGAKWIDSWDFTFKGSDKGGDFVVGQRWARKGPTRYLIAQQRGRWSFTQSLERIKAWTDGGGPYGSNVHSRIVEDAANGPAIIDVLKKEVSGIKPINPKASKEARARASTPEIESGHVRLPLPSDAGNGWVADFLSEVRNFPHDAHDDQVDAMTQALAELRTAGAGSISTPARTGRTIPRRATTGFTRR